MIPEATKPLPNRRPRAPKIVINADNLAHIEALAEGAMDRDPDLADRLLDEIGRARIVKPARMPSNVVAMGSTVTYRDETTGIGRTVTLTYPEDADISLHRISLMTPIGIALLGLAEGAVFSWDTRADQRKILTVIRVETSSDETQPLS